MRLLENAFTQSDSQVLMDNENVKIEVIKLSDDLTMATITVQAYKDYVFTSRSGVLTTQIGSGVISTPNESVELTLFNKVALNRNDRVTITNNQTYPLVLNFISAN